MEKYAFIGVIVMLSCFPCIAAQNARADEQGKLKTIEQLVKEAQDGADYIGIDEMKERIKKNNKLVLLDVRTRREYDAGHIKGAAWIERGIAEFVLVRTLPDPNAEIVVYCKQGNRTGLVIKALKAAGYTSVTGLKVGFDGWAEKGNPVQNFLGEFRMVQPNKINAASFGVDLYENKN